MTPLRRVGLALSQTTTHVAAVSDWVERKGARLGPQEATLRQALAKLAADLDVLEQAVDRRSAIGLAAVGDCSGLAVLAARLIDAGQREAPAGERWSLREGISSLIAPDGDKGSSAAVRFAAREMAQSKDPGLVDASLLSLADVAAIASKAFHAATPGAFERAAAPERTEMVIREAAQCVAAAAIPGLARRDVVGLKAQLGADLPLATGLRDLAAQGYWDGLADMALHLPTDERIKVLALLWGETPEFTRIVQHLAAMLSRLSWASEILVPREVLAATQPARADGAQAARSLIAAGSLATLLDENDASVRVAARHGLNVSLPRAAVAALLGEIVIDTGTAPLAEAPDADLVVLPSGPKPGASRAARSTDTTGAPEAGTSAPAIEAFLGAKVQHLVERAVRRHELSALAVLVDTLAAPSDALAPAIADWIGITHGATPAQRELARPALFVVAAAGAGVGAATGAAIRADRPRRVTEAIVESIGGGLDWTVEWVPGQPFSNIVLYRRDDGEARGGGSQSLPDASSRRLAAVRLVESFGLQGHAPGDFSEDTDALVAELAAPSGGAARLARGLAAAGRSEVRAEQLRRHAAELRRGLRLRLGRLGVGEDSEDRAQARRRLATLIEHRVTRAARRGRLGLLLDALGARDSDLVAALGRSRDTRGGNGAPTRGNADPARMARAAIAQWFAGMHATASSRRLAADLGLDTALVEQVVEEIAAGAHRLGLEEVISGEIDRTLARLARQPKLRSDGLVAQSAALICNGFLERLDVSAPRSSLTHHSAMRERFETEPMPAFGEPRALTARWPLRLGRLIEGNIALAGHAAPGEGDATLLGVMERIALDTMEPGL